MLEDFREISVIDPLTTDYALYEMLGFIFRGDAEALSNISREVAHSVSVLGLGRRRAHEKVRPACPSKDW
jgi:hypothetical protein